MRFCFHSSGGASASGRASASVSAATVYCGAPATVSAICRGDAPCADYPAHSFCGCLHAQGKTKKSAARSARGREVHSAFSFTWPSLAPRPGWDGLPVCRCWARQHYESKNRLTNHSTGAGETFLPSFLAGEGAGEVLSFSPCSVCPPFSSFSLSSRSLSSPFCACAVTLPSFDGPDIAAPCSSAPSVDPRLVPRLESAASSSEAHTPHMYWQKIHFFTFRPWDPRQEGSTTW